MKVEEDQFTFESTGRAFRTHADGLSLSYDGNVRGGYDSYTALIDKEGQDEYDFEFTDEEKKELAIYIIEQWANWGGLPTKQ